MMRAAAAALGLLLLPASWNAVAAASSAPTIDPGRVMAHEAFLAGDALRGRASATRDEAIAAAYVGAQFQAAGLSPAPGMNGYIQSVPLLRQRLAGSPVLTAGGAAISGVSLIRGSGGMVRGKAAVITGSRAAIPKARILVIDAPAVAAAQVSAAIQASGAELIITNRSEAIEAPRARTGAPSLPIYPAGGAPPTRGAIITVPPDQMKVIAAAARGGAELAMTIPFTIEQTVTSNAVGYLPGTDPNAGVVLLSAHLDHFGQRPDGVVLYGANDDASGVVAVLELARALAMGPRPRRGIVFATYGSEEIGGFGARHFAANPPLPLARIIANVQFEMIGNQDPKLPRGSLMMTGFERSTLGEMLRSQGARLVPDPYKEEDFFRRSDNYALALKGGVAHTVAGWAGPTYHDPSDTIANLDVPFMVGAIQSMVEPMRRLANSEATPRWRPGGRPKQ